MASIKKNILKRMEKFEPREQPTVFDEDGGYTTLTRTKGWRTVSGKRIRAQQKMMQLYGFVR